MRTTFFKVSVLTLLFGSFFVSCNDDDNNDYNPVVMDNTIVDVAKSNNDFSTLVLALDRAGLVETLDGNGKFTVFAPTNAAFSTFLDANGYNSINDVPVAALKQVLLNHVIAGTAAASSTLTTGYVRTEATGMASSSNKISMFINTTGGVTINGGVSNGGAVVSTADIMADNGIIHVVNRVIALPTVTSLVVANPDFSSLTAALTRDDQPDFAGILSGTANSPFTVFAPTNAAFTSFLNEYEFANLNAVPQSALENTLKYHVVTGSNVLSTSLTNNMSVTTFQGQSFTVNTTGGASITDANNRMSTITAADVQASNGVIHTINKVLFPQL
ncbi:fasciclin [Nostoc linckia z13]|uniref:fasciclin domain-containing protein n=1 Tax=Nostoc linckia TaxID=92942 RepID=UPI000BFFCEB6|nr:fasciclin [Nostoc linckia z13]